MVAEIGRSPEQEEPPHAISKQLTHDERPCLAEGETLPEGDGFLLLDIRTVLHLHNIVVLFNIVQLGLVHITASMRFVIEPYPQTHPYEA